MNRSSRTTSAVPGADAKSGLGQRWPPSAPSYGCYEPNRREPGRPRGAGHVPGIRAASNRSRRSQRTIFPSSLYEDPGFDWTPGLPAKAVRELDDAALDLYSSYLDMLPLLTSVRAKQPRNPISLA